MRDRIVFYQPVNRSDPQFSVIIFGDAADIFPMQSDSLRVMFILFRLRIK